MAEKKLTHEEADRRLLEAMKPSKLPKQSGAGLLNKLKEIAGSRKAGAETPPPPVQEV